VTAAWLLVAALLIMGNAFFVGAEFALISARRDRVEPLAAHGDRRARTVLTAIAHLSPMLAAAQLGITVCSLGLGAVGEPGVGRLLSGLLDALGMPSGVRRPIAFVVALLIVAALHMVLGEIVPKNLALAGPERAALWLGPALVGFAMAARPIVVAVNGLANGCLRLLRVNPADELNTAYTPEELASMISASRHEGLLREAEHELLTSALGLPSRTAAAVMVPIDAVVTVAWSVTAPELEEVVAETGYSRFPVRPPGDAERGPGGGPGTGSGTGAAAGDEFVGFVHAKDVLGLSPAEREQPLPAMRLRRMVTIGADEPLDVVLRTMQRAGSHLARVVGPGAATAGVIALEDVVEEFVGEVDDASHRRG
jgi:CBS domain containing-hemolysin-like protein